jgi:hypothetical protein
VREISIEKWQFAKDGTVVASGVVLSSEGTLPYLGTFEFRFFPELLDVQLAYPSAPE